MPEKYTTLPQEEDIARDDDGDCINKHREDAKSSRMAALIMAIFLMSFCSNIFLIYQLSCQISAPTDTSRYAYNSRNVTTTRRTNTTYTHPDRKVQDAAWADPLLNAERAYVALSDDYSEAVGLPHSTRWPWDKTKGIYVIAGLHEMHCLHTLRRVINEAHDGVPLSDPYGHALHCLDVLRESVMCNADDEPLYTGALHAQRGVKSPKAGIGSIRMCRDWNRLSAWALERSACWSSEKLQDGTIPQEERFKHCPDGSKPWELVNG